MRKENRKRCHELKLRATEQEYRKIKEKASSTGLTTQSLLLNSVLAARIIPADETSAMHEALAKLASYYTQLRGMGTNINQLVRTANTTGFMPNRSTLEEMAARIEDTKKEVMELCLFLKQQTTLPEV